MALPATTIARPTLPDRRALNPIKHGGFSKAVLLPGENADERRALEQSYIEYFNPTSQPELDIIMRIADLVWRRARLDRAEAALATAAIRRAETQLPAPVQQLALEVHHMRADLDILLHVLDRVEEESETGRKHVLVGFAPVVDRLLGWRESVADVEVDRFITIARHTYEARSREVESAERILDMMKNAVKPEAEAAKADAGMLDPRKAAVIEQRRVSIERSIARELKVLGELRGGFSFEGVVAAGTFRKTSPATPRVVGEVA